MGVAIILYKFLGDVVKFDLSEGSLRTEMSSDGEKGSTRVSAYGWWGN